MNQAGDIVLFAFESCREFGAHVAERIGILWHQWKNAGFKTASTRLDPSSTYVTVMFTSFSLSTPIRKSRSTTNWCGYSIFLGSLRDASAGRVTAVIPYLAYARKDRKSKSRDPLTSRYIAQFFEAMSIDHLVTIDVHNLAAFQNAFRIRTEHLEATRPLAEHVAGYLRDAGPVAVVSPDAGGIKRARAFRDILSHLLDREIGIAMMEKTRSAGELSSGELYGDVGGRRVVIVDDMISTGGTLALAARASRAAGAVGVDAVATHGVFVGGANQVLRGQELDRVITTDTVRPVKLDPTLALQKLTQVTVTDLFGAAIRRLHEGGSIVQLVEGGV